MWETMPDLHQRALALLSRREHSRAELSTKLARHAASADELAAELDDLQARQLLSDERYACARVNSRGLRYGNRRLRNELHQAGLSDDDISAALAQAGDESERCRQVWARKFSALPDSPASRAKQIRFLSYRGFSSDTIARILRGDTE